MANDMTLAFGAARRGLPDCRPTPVCDPRPVCPACGGLECLCRPRFFAGQLLTEEDLNRLDHYIVAKNRLHNRYLFGTGVVCGLEVVCSTCDPAGGGTVVVKAGYALSPCGDDIIVCKDESVDVCDLINRCRPRAPDECLEGAARPADCQQGTEDWVLAICYREKQSRGITALRGSSCSCGGHGSGGCGCGGHSASASNASNGSASYGAEASCGCGGGVVATTARTRAAARAGPTPPQCEPTVTCEGYTFAVYKRPPADPNRADPGALIRRFLCCLEPLLEQLKTLPNANSTREELQEWLREFMTTVREFLITEGLYDCDLAARLAAVAMPPIDANDADYQRAWNASALGVLAILGALFQKCFCSALLPPCPPSELTDCVPIATVTVARQNCRAIRICNIGSRRFLLTIPALEYWLSWLPPFSNAQTLRSLIDRICCPPVTRLFEEAGQEKVDLRPPRAAASSGAGAPAKAAASGRAKAGGPGAVHPFAQLLGESFASQPRADAARLVLAEMGARAADRSPLVSDVALEHPGEALLIHQVLGPALSPLLPLFGGRAAAEPDVDGLTRKVEALQKQVTKQQTAINELKRKR
jgi:hypothetical protein